MGVEKVRRVGGVQRTRSRVKIRVSVPEGERGGGMKTRGFYSVTRSNSKALKVPKGQNPFSAQLQKQLAMEASALSLELQTPQHSRPIQLPKTKKHKDCSSEHCYLSARQSYDSLSHLQKIVLLVLEFREGSSSGRAYVPLGSGSRTIYLHGNLAQAAKP